MSNELVTKDEESARKLIRDTFCKGATDNEFELFSSMCKKTGLDPTMKQVYAVKRWNSSLKREEMTVQTGIDGFRLIADRTGKYAPGKEALFAYNKDGNLLSATAFIKKQTQDGSWHDVSATAFFEEYCQRTKEGTPSNFWKKMPHVMLSKCAEALALRKAFPAEMSGIYIKEEMDQAENISAPLEQAEVISQVADERKIEAPLESIDDSHIEFVQKVSGIEDKENLKKYILRCCTHYNMKPEEVMEKWVSDPEQRNKSFQKWMSKQAS